MSVNNFERPWILLLVIAPGVALVVQLLLRRLKQRRWRRLGNVATLRQFVDDPIGLTHWRIAVLILAWLSLSIAVAGPRWGEVDTSGIAVGRDIVIVLDFSRSMWAEDMLDAKHPARWQAAVKGAEDLVSLAKNRGGDRLGIVVFAAQPYTLVPLTTDYDHLLLRLDALDARAPPAEIVPANDAVASGTRIGAAIVSALSLHDERFPGFQEIVLFTDADDPVPDDEWRRGVSAARAANVPVHVVALGDPSRDSFILRDGEPLEGLTRDGIRAQIQTRLKEEVAKEIAVETRGSYLASKTTVPDLGEFYRSTIADQGHREVADERRPQPRDRASWFYGATMILVLLSYWNRRSIIRNKPAAITQAMSVNKLLILIFSLLAVSASPDVELEALRTGLAHLEAGENEAALRSFELAARLTDDPGIVAFDRGIALARLGRFRDAEVQFIRCLDDSEIPMERRARALYNRGVCLIDRDDIAAIRMSIDCFAASRDISSDPQLTADAKFNLELAKLRWHAMKPRTSQAPTPNDGSYDDPSRPDSSNGSADGRADTTTGTKPTTEKAGGNPANPVTPRTPGAGTLPVLKDDSVLTPMSSEETQVYLEQLAERLRRQRQNVERLRAGPDCPGVRDW